MSNKAKFVLQNFTLILLFVFIAHWFGSMPFPGDNMAVINDPNSPRAGYGFLSVFYVLLCIILFVVSVAWTSFMAWDTDQDNQGNEEWYAKYLIVKKITGMKFKVWAFISIVLILIVGSKIITNLAGIYNASVVYNKQYDQKVTERLGFYDKLWKTFLAKEKITNLNRETFIEVATIQMENRKDGSAVTWKWVQENSPIPYEQFTKFYADLSDFIETQRDKYYNLETQCQDIATAHNMLIDTFPNNIYNKILGRKHIDFKYGFLSDSTRNVFNSRNENVQP